MRKSFIFQKIPVTPSSFWPLFHEKDPFRFLSLLHSTRFLEDPSLLTPKTAALLIYSYSKKVPHPPDPPTQSKLLLIYNTHKLQMNPQDFVNVLWSFSKIQPKNTSLFLELENTLSPIESSLKLRERVTVIHSFGKATQGSQAFWVQQELFLERNLGFLPEKELSIVVWSLARSDSRLNNEQLWAKIEARILESKPKNIEYLASLCYSFGRKQAGSRDLWGYFETMIAVNLKSMKPRYFANFLWAFAKSGHHKIENPLILGNLEGWVLKEGKGGGFRDLMNVLWACNKMNIPEREGFWEMVFRGLEKREKEVWEMNSQDLMNLAWILMVRSGVSEFEGLWKVLGGKFKGYLRECLKEIQEERLEAGEFQVKAHECFYLGKGGMELWREVGEAVYLEYLIRVEKSGETEKARENVKEIGILALKMDKPPQSQKYRDLQAILLRLRS